MLTTLMLITLMLITLACYFLPAHHKNNHQNGSSVGDEPTTPQKHFCQRHGGNNKCGSSGGRKEED